MKRFLVRYEILGSIIVDAEDERQAIEKVAEKAWDDIEGCSDPQWDYSAEELEEDERPSKP